MFRIWSADHQYRIGRGDLISGDNGRAGAGERLVRKERRVTSTPFYQDFMTRRSQFGDRFGYERHPALGWPGLLDHGYLHRGGPRSGGSCDAANWPRLGQQQQVWTMASEE